MHAPVGEVLLHLGDWLPIYTHTSPQSWNPQHHGSLLRRQMSYGMWYTSKLRFVKLSATLKSLQDPVKWSSSPMKHQYQKNAPKRKKLLNIKKIKHHCSCQHNHYPSGKKRHSLQYHKYKHASSSWVLNSWLQIQGSHLGQTAVHLSIYGPASRSFCKNGFVGSIML